MELSPARIGQVVTAAREKWRRNPSITALRDTVAQMIEAHGAAMTMGELCEAALNARGSVASEPRRSQLAAIVVRAAVEVERDNESPRFIERRLENDRILITRFAEMAGYVEQLARVADGLARLDPISTPARALEMLREARPPDSITPLTDVRLVKLAVAASSTAALSSRLGSTHRDWPQSCSAPGARGVDRREYFAGRRDLPASS